MIKVKHKENISGGSDAATYIVEFTNGEKFFKKEANGSAALKLREQAVWLDSVKDKIPVPEVINAKGDSDYYEYYMPFEENVKTLGTSILEGNTSEKLFRDIFNSLKNVYGECHAPSEKEIREYYDEKVVKNLNIVKKNSNNVEILHLIDKMFNWDHFYSIMKNDMITDTAHGDLTAENIIIRPDGSFYFIDSNSGNKMNSKFLDYGKFLQSVHGNYELIMKERSLDLNKDDIAKYSFAYDNFITTVSLSKEDMLICYYHELVHWLRLIPYKVKSNYAPEVFIERFFELVNIIANYEGINNG